MHKFWSDICTYLQFPINYHVKQPNKKERTNCQKFKISNFIILLTTLVETLPRSMSMNFWEQIWCVLSKEMLFGKFTPI